MGYLRRVPPARKLKRLMKPCGWGRKAGFLEPDPNELLGKDPPRLSSPPAHERIVRENPEVFEDPHGILRDKGIGIAGLAHTLGEASHADNADPPE
jgi:hypothetical protein